MTTIAWDGKLMAADTLAVDTWGLKEPCFGKIKEGRDFLAGISGSYGQGERWWQEVQSMSFKEVFQRGLPDFDKDKTDLSVLLVGRDEGRVKVCRLADGIFYECPYRTFAIGSGRDYALASLHWGKTAAEAVECARNFDNSTGLTVIVRALP